MPTGKFASVWHSLDDDGANCPLARILDRAAYPEERQLAHQLMNWLDTPLGFQFISLVLGSKGYVLDYPATVLEELTRSVRELQASHGSGMTEPELTELLNQIDVLSGLSQDSRAALAAVHAQSDKVQLLIDGHTRLTRG